MQIVENVQSTRCAKHTKRQTDRERERLKKREIERQGQRQTQRHRQKKAEFNGCRRNRERERQTDN